MPRMIEAIYEGGLLKPIKPLDITENTRVRITIEPIDEAHKNVEHTLAIARQGYEGLSKEELAAIESAKLKSEIFFR